MKNKCRCTPTDSDPAHGWVDGDCPVHGIKQLDWRVRILEVVVVLTFLIFVVLMILGRVR